jgi:hypothetical protein
MPTALSGYTDWQHFCERNGLFPIEVKLVATGVLIPLLFIAFVFSRKSESEIKGILMIYILSLLTVTVCVVHFCDKIGEIIVTIHCTTLVSH